MADQPIAEKRRGTNIVLFSDGTGNSSAKLLKTNVWRMYEALDLLAGDQIAVYDNGVGTSSVPPLAIVGGALGFGLKRNVRTLYMYACRHFQPGTAERDADRLYAFGFSRGAFTVRVLIGLIESQGLITGVTGQELERQAKWAYREYRRQFTAAPWVIKPLRWIRDVALRLWEGAWGRKPYDPSKNLRPDVTFLGLWDMVDAYGLPIDELTRGWNRWVWPLSMNANERPTKVKKVCHAVALDDERHTFHPVLLDEEHLNETKTRIRDESVSQVWFPGAHSNVGGGYPDDSLARVPLLWMAAAAEHAGLRLHRIVTDEWRAHADPNGPGNDSRRGFGSYYRYSPRSIQKLTDDRFAKVAIPRPKIHESVFKRIARGRDTYAPIVLPSTYAVVSDNGDIMDVQQNPFESPSQAVSRCRNQERVWNWVWLRRGLYFTTVLLTLWLLVPPFISDPDDAPFLNPRSRALAGVLDAAGAFLPDMFQPVVAFYRENPVQFFAMLSGLVLLMLASLRVQRRIHDEMRSLWMGILSAPATPVTPSAPPNDFIYRFRSNYFYRNFVEFTSQRALPFLFGVAALLVLIVVAVGTTNRAVFAVASATGSTCRPWLTPRQADADGRWVLEKEFVNREMCYSTGVPIEPGRRYRIDIELPEEGWYDLKHHVTSAEGFSSIRGGPIFLAALPFRRVFTARWFVPIARVGDRQPEYHTIENGTVEFVPRQQGQLFLFVNDAIGPPGMTKYFYNNNNGPPARVIVSTPTADASP